MNINSYYGFLCGLSAGLFLGATGALLVAPRSGRELRQGIAERGRKMRDSLNGPYFDARERGRKALSKTREALHTTSEGLKEAGRALTGA